MLRFGLVFTQQHISETPAKCLRHGLGALRPHPDPSPLLPPLSFLKTGAGVLVQFSAGPDLQIGPFQKSYLSFLGPSSMVA